MDLLLLIVGSKENLIKVNRLDANNIETVKVDERDLARPKIIINKIKQQKYNNVYFGTIENKLQRFHIFMKLWMLAAGTINGGIIDELGNYNKFNIFKLFIIELPKLFLETIASAFVVIYYYLTLPLLKRRMLK